MEKLFLIPFEERKNCHLKGFIHKTEKSKHKKFLQIWAQMPNVKNSWWKPSQIENFNKSKSKCIEEVKPFDINENGTWFVCFWNGFPLYLIPKIAQITAEWNHFGGIFVFFNQHDFRWNREVLNAEKMTKFIENGFLWNMDRDSAVDYVSTMASKEKSYCDFIKIFSSAIA